MQEYRSRTYTMTEHAQRSPRKKNIAKVFVKIPSIQNPHHNFKGNFLAPILSIVSCSLSLPLFLLRELLQLFRELDRRQ